MTMWQEITETEYLTGFNDRVCLAKGKMHGGGEYWEYGLYDEPATHRVEYRGGNSRCFVFVPNGGN
jgi:hypothetical protein